MKYDELNLQKLRELPIFDVCSKLGITLYGMGKLTKRATCWYHDDKHPSMHVNKKKNIFKCFVCGKGGDVIRLVQDYDNKSFIEACDWLVNEFHVILIEDPRKLVNHGDCPNDSSEAEIRGTVPCDSIGSTRAVTSSIRHLPSDLVSRSLSVDSLFCKSVVSVGYLSDSQLRHAASRYRLGCSKDGGVIFWQIDEQQHVHTGKIMYYQPDCHRDKQRHPTWIHYLMKDKLPADYDFQPCLFGLHLLTSDIGHEPSSIAIVESEKTAIILSEKFPNFIWLSCGGLQQFKPQLLEPLLQYRIIIFPDTDPQGEAFRQWSQVASDAQHLYKFRYPLRISPLLELQSTPDQKQRKIDLVDFLFSE